jgi:hypothetical protein
MPLRIATAALLAALILAIPTPVSGQPIADALLVDAAVAAEPLLPAPAARPLALHTLYVSYATLQAFDTYSTLTALAQGGTETNPLARGFVQSPTAMVAVKSAMTFATIYAAERMWRRHHGRSALVLMVVTNAVMIAVAAQNASVLHAQRR